MKFLYIYFSSRSSFEVTLHQLPVVELIPSFHWEPVSTECTICIDHKLST